MTAADDMAAAHGAPTAGAAPTVAGDVVTALMVAFDGDDPPALLFAPVVAGWTGAQMAATGSGCRASTGGPAVDRVESSPTPFVLRLTVTLMALIAVRPTVSGGRVCGVRVNEKLRPFVVGAVRG